MLDPNRAALLRDMELGLWSDETSLLNFWGNADRWVVVAVDQEEHGGKGSARWLRWTFMFPGTVSDYMHAH